MKKLFKHLIFTIIIILCSLAVSLGQARGVSKVYFDKVKFLMTEVNFRNLKANKSYVGLIMFENISKKTLRIAAVTKELNSIIINVKSQIIRPKQKGILTYTIIKPAIGEHHSSSLIFFKNFNDPVKIDINGSFL